MICEVAASWFTQQSFERVMVSWVRVRVETSLRVTYVCLSKSGGNQRSSKIDQVNLIHGRRNRIWFQPFSLCFSSPVLLSYWMIPNTSKKVKTIINEVRGTLWLLQGGKGHQQHKNATEGRNTWSWNRSVAPYRWRTASPSSGKYSDFCLFYFIISFHLFD